MEWYSHHKYSYNLPEPEWSTLERPSILEKFGLGNGVWGANQNISFAKDRKEKNEKKMPMAGVEKWDD